MDGVELKVEGWIMKGYEGKYNRGAELCLWLNYFSFNGYMKTHIKHCIGVIGKASKKLLSRGGGVSGFFFFV